jgi:hypothetical protein
MNACVAGWYGAWTLLDGAGTTIAGGSCGAGDRRVDALPAGTYRLEVTPERDVVGTYALEILQVPDPQVFDVVLPGPAQVPGDIEGAGAGSLETKASTDVYRFTLTGERPSVAASPRSCPRPDWRSQLIWSLVNDAGAVVASGGCSPRDIEGLSPGAYRLEVRPEEEATGAYALELRQQGPTPELTARPDATNNKTSANFGFTAADPGVTFECALDVSTASGPFTACPGHGLLWRTRRRPAHVLGTGH